MVHIPYWEADSFAATQEILCIFWNRKLFSLSLSRARHWTASNKLGFSPQSHFTCMEQIRSCEANSSSASQEISRPFSVRKFFYIAHKHRPSSPIQSQINPVRNHWPYLRSILILYHHLLLVLLSYVLFWFFRKKCCKHIHTLTPYLNVKSLIYT